MAETLEQKDVIVNSDFLGWQFKSEICKTYRCKFYLGFC